VAENEVGVRLVAGARDGGDQRRQVLRSAR